MRTSARAALLAAAMNFTPAVPVDIFRFLRVPAIVFRIRQVKGRVCRDRHPHTRKRGPRG
jgi:hypothetical protein